MAKGQFKCIALLTQWIYFFELKNKTYPRPQRQGNEDDLGNIAEE